MASSMRVSSAPLIPSSQRGGLGWATVAFLFVIVVFGVVFIGYMPKWPIYVTILAWWAFVIFATIHITHQKDAPISEG
jgi:hypothetical protein